MSDRGLPIADTALACPFIAFEDDREGRALSPDGRHRCYAEVRPAPRALAHQEAYCLTSAFSVCPTFLDWARREAAQTRPAPVADPLVEEAAGRAASAGARADAELISDEARRNPPRDWLSPPPWMSSGPDDESEGREAADDDPGPQPVPPRGSGLSGSFADRILADPPTLEPSATWVPPVPRTPTVDPRVEGPADSDEDDEEDEENARPAKEERSSRRARSGQGRDAARASRVRIAPSWERPPRREAYPTLKTRIGLGQLSVSPILFWIVALAIAVVVLFSLPAILGIGNPPTPTSAPTPSASAGGLAASSAPEGPTPVPQPSAQVYVVQAGDTMSRIANRFSIPLQLLIDANKEAIPNPDKLQLGQEVIIPLTTPTLLPNEAPSPSP